MRKKPLLQSRGSNTEGFSGKETEAEYCIFSLQVYTVQNLCCILPVIIRHSREDKMIGYITRKKAVAALLILLLIVNGTIGTCFSLVMSALIDCASGRKSELLTTLLGSVLFVIVYVLVGTAYQYVKIYIIAEARKNLKNDLFECIYSRSMTEYEQGSSAEYINELSNNINIFESTWFQNIIVSGDLIVSFVSAAVICIAVQPLMLLVMLVLAFLTLGITKITTGPLEKSMREYSISLEEYTAEVKDDFSGFGVIHLFHTVNAVIHKHRQKNGGLESAKRKSENCRTYCAYAGQFVGLLSTVLVMAAAAYFSQKGMFSAGMIIAFGHLIGNIVSPITAIPSVIADFHASKPVKESFCKILKTGKAEGGEGTVLPNGDIRLDRVTFGYGDKCVLNDCTYCFENGKHYVLIGSSGEGKSSLLNLVAGIYQNYEGNISVGGADIRTAGRNHMADAVAMVKQDTFLFNDSIRNNITLFREGWSDQELTNVLAQTGLKEMISALPDGLETGIRENGSNFSGGEKQRIGLGRVLLHNSRILLLDEFTANLDPKTAQELEDNILNRRDTTVITVTHQRDEEKLKKYDCVVMLKDGKLEECSQGR